MLTLKDLLTFFTTYGASEAAYWLMEKVKYLAQLQPECKKYTALAIAFVVADLAWLATVGLGYVTMPVGFVSWLEMLVGVGLAGSGLSQVWHARRELRGRVRENK